MAEEPIDLDDDENYSHEERLYYFLREWGLAEIMLDQCNALIAERYDRREPKRRFPVTLEKKLAFLREAYVEIEGLPGPHDLVAEICRLFVSEKDVRNVIVHGVPLKHEDDGTVHFIMIRPGRSGPDYKYRRVSPKDWDRLDDVSTKLFAWLLVVMLALEPIAENSPFRASPPDRAALVDYADRLPFSKRIRELMQEIFAAEA